MGLSHEAGDRNEVAIASKKTCLVAERKNAYKTIRRRDGEHDRSQHQNACRVRQEERKTVLTSLPCATPQTFSSIRTLYTHKQTHQRRQPSRQILTEAARWAGKLPTPASSLCSRETTPSAHQQTKKERNSFALPCSAGLVTRDFRIRYQKTSSKKRSCRAEQDKKDASYPHVNNDYSPYLNTRHHLQKNRPRVTRKKRMTHFLCIILFSPPVQR